MSEYSQKVITIDGISYRTDVTLVDVVEAAEDLKEGLDALENCRVARFNKAGTAYATADLGEEVCGYLTHQDSELTAHTSKGQQFIGVKYAMRLWPSSIEGNSPPCAHLYVEKSLADRLIPPAPTLGRAFGPMKITDYLAAGYTLKDGERYKFSLRRKYGSREEISGVRESGHTETRGVYWGTMRRGTLVVYLRGGHWNVANATTGKTCSSIGLKGASGCSSGSLHETWIEGVALGDTCHEGKSPETLNVGNLVLNPQGETLEIVEMTESFIIAKVCAMQDESVRALALPIIQAETLKVLGIAKAF